MANDYFGRRRTPFLLASALCLSVITGAAAAQQRAGSSAGQFGGSPPLQGAFHSWWQEDDRALFEEALALTGLTADEFQLPVEQVGVWGGDRYRLPRFDLFFKNIWAISPFTHRLARTILDRADSPLALSYLVQSPTGFRVRDSVYSSYLTTTRERVEADGAMALANALEHLGAGDADEIAKEDGYAELPPEVNRAASMLVYQIVQASAYRAVGLTEPLEAIGFEPQDVYDDMYSSIFFGQTLDDTQPTAPHELARETLEMNRILEAVDLNTVFRGANALMLGAQYAKDELTGEHIKQREVELLREAAPKDDEGEVIDPDALEKQIAGVTASDLVRHLADASFAFAIETDLGWIRLSGAGSQTYGASAEEGHDLLVIDTGGDDVYVRAASTPSYAHGIAVTIDLVGNDTYQSPDYNAWDEYSKRVDGRSDEFEYHMPEDHEPSFAAGVCGYGVLLDLAGDDRYASTFVGQGAAIMGFAMLYDSSGNDTYTGDTMLQGAARFGAAALVDREGDDTYLCFLRSQGYAGTLGSGLILDTAGDDRYHAVNFLSKDEFGYTVKYAWFNDEPDALNMSQGYAHGRRADMSDGHSRAGGVGMLIDGGSGDDIYEADIFCQGSSYWYSLGTLYDDGGDDRYTASAYGIASPVHFTVGVLIDVAGDDVYRAHRHHGCGFARDLSIGWFEDGGGHDTYYGNDSAFGVGNVNSLAVFWDRGGDDTYFAREKSFGQPTIGGTGSIRDVIVNSGMFIDAAGQDRYFALTDEMVARSRRPFDYGKDEGLEPFVLQYRGEQQEMSDGIRASWHSVHDDSPGSTGAIVDHQDWDDGTPSTN
ncbi:MAG: hypothetical protein AAGI30_00140 [Planctomycetota bacterium]